MKMIYIFFTYLKKVSGEITIVNDVGQFSSYTMFFSYIKKLRLKYGELILSDYKDLSMEEYVAMKNLKGEMTILPGANDVEQGL